MKKTPFILFLALLLCACATESISTSALQPPDPAYVIPADIVHLSHTTQPYAIAVLDKITIRKADGTSATFQVNQEGRLPLEGESSGPVVKGLTVDALRALVERDLKGSRLVWVEEFRPANVTILGEVFHQIHTQMSDGPMRVLDAIAAANGFTPLANTRRVKLMRENAGEVDIYELDLRQTMQGRQFDQDLLLKPGDVITVPKNFL